MGKAAGSSGGPAYLFYVVFMGTSGDTFFFFFCKGKLPYGAVRSCSCFPPFTASFTRIWAGIRGKLQLGLLEFLDQDERQRNATTSSLCVSVIDINQCRPTVIRCSAMMRFVSFWNEQGRRAGTGGVLPEPTSQGKGIIV